jgi:hypothetical protein
MNLRLITIIAKRPEVQAKKTAVKTEGQAQAKS